ncbi:hypothetical protein ACIOHO_36075 [Streptomyces sp. NPDC087849]|uniref:hypothetical protein n=1 Tax=Streptomyces sp. NPDC087849 TaxID=3365808 RepID=UPI00382737F1
MTLLPGAGDNTDCDLVARLWQLLDTPASGQWYLGSIIRDGLRVPALGIDIPPFPVVSIGDIPEQTTENGRVLVGTYYLSERTTCTRTRSSR